MPGPSSTGGPSPTTRPASPAPSPAWPATAIPRTSWWPSSRRTGCSSNDSWPPVTRSSRSTKRVQRHPAPLGASRAKTDPGDSYKLADYLRTDGHRLRRLTLPDQHTRDLQQLVRLRDDHVATKVAATKQLAALPARHWPGADTLWAHLDSPVCLAFLTDYPTWASARRLGETRVAQFCSRHHYSGRRTPTDSSTGSGPHRNRSTRRQ